MSVKQPAPDGLGDIRLHAHMYTCSILLGLCQRGA